MQDYMSIISILFNNKPKFLTFDKTITEDGFIIGYYHLNNSVLQCAYFEMDKFYKVIYDKQVKIFDNHKLFIDYVEKCLNEYIKPMYN